MEGEFYTPEKTKFVPADRPQQVRPQDNLKQTGEFYSPEKSKFVPADRPQQVRPEDNLKPNEGEFVRPEKTKFIPAERPSAVRPVDQVCNYLFWKKKVKRWYYKFQKRYEYSVKINFQKLC